MAKLGSKLKRKKTQKAQIKDDCVFIECLNGVFTFDLEDLNVYEMQSWTIKKFRYGRKYVYGRPFNGSGLFHRAIMKADKSQQVDHINGDTLDNRKSNLRICNSVENSYNRGKQNNRATSAFKGVYVTGKFRKDGSPIIYANVGKKRKYLSNGTFRSEIDAAKWYNEKAVELFGPFARLNEIPNE